jgi:SAM-dependent methyltransferase
LSAVEIREDAMGRQTLTIAKMGKTVVQRIANKLGYEIRRLPPPLVPPPPHDIRLMVGPFDDANQYQEAGKQWLQLCKDLCDLRPSERVLDVGCCCGQAAAALTKYLNRRGAYEGFDIVPLLVEWCVKNISPQYSNFRFRLSNVLNKYYNPTGASRASKYAFPYGSESFDFVFLKSVFTHMLPADMARYFSEIARVSKRGGRCLISFFLLNTESLLLINAGRSTQNFRFVCDGYRTTDENAPESAVAYDEETVRKVVQKSGLAIVEPIHYGSWCGRNDFVSYQDLIVAEKSRQAAEQGIQSRVTDRLL